MPANRNFCIKYTHNRIIWLVNHSYGTNTDRDDNAVLQKGTLPQACSKLAQWCLQDGEWKPNEALGQSEYNNGFRSSNSYKWFIMMKATVYVDCIHMQFHTRRIYVILESHSLKYFPFWFESWILMETCFCSIYCHSRKWSHKWFNGDLCQNNTIVWLDLYGNNLMTVGYDLNMYKRIRDDICNLQ